MSDAFEKLKKLKDAAAIVAAIGTPIAIALSNSIHDGLIVAICVIILVIAYTTGAGCSTSDERNAGLHIYFKSSILISAAVVLLTFSYGYLMDRTAPIVKEVIASTLADETKPPPAKRKKIEKLQTTDQIIMSIGENNLAVAHINNTHAIIVKIEGLLNSIGDRIEVFVANWLDILTGVSILLFGAFKYLQVLSKAKSSTADNSNGL